MLLAGAQGPRGGTAMPISFFSVKNIDELDFNKLVRMLPPAGSGGAVRRAYVRTILESQDLLKRYEIDNPNRLAHFIGQGVVETGWLTKTVENLNYSAERLRQVWPSRFRTDEIAREYARQPQRIANFVYSNRLGNGPPESNDGWTYRGRGFFQLTGRQNYRTFGQIAGFDLENNPAEVEDMKKSIEVAAAYFRAVGLGAYADADDAAAVSRGVNLGDPRSTTPAHAEADRVLWTSRAIELVKDPNALLARASEEPDLRVGATGDRVRALQRDLADLGYPVGTVDGVFGPATRRAVVNFQEERRLPTTGVVDAATRAAIEGALAPITVNAPTPPPPMAPSTTPPDSTPAAPLPELAPSSDATAPTPPRDTAQPPPDAAPPSDAAPPPADAAPSSDAASVPPDSTPPTGETSAAPVSEEQAPVADAPPAAPTADNAGGGGGGPAPAQQPSQPQA